MTTDQPKFSEVVRLIGGDGEGTLNVDANADQNADDGYQQQHEVEFTSPIKRRFLAAFYEEEFLKQMMTLKQRRDPFCGRTCLAKLNEPIIIRKAQFLAFVASIGLPDTRNKVYRCLVMTFFLRHFNSQKNHCEYCIPKCGFNLCRET